MSFSKDGEQPLPGGIRLDKRAGEVYRNGLKITLPEQLFRLLVLLGEHPGEVVSREEIRKTLWSDTFVNYDDSINSAIRRLRHYLENADDSPQLIETLPGHGYRFILAANSTEEVPASRANGHLPIKHRLAVLPFDNLSGNPADEYLADSLTDAVITELAKISALHVKPRCLVMGYKQLHQGLAATGKKLKVDAVLQGSLVHLQGRVRITAQLLNVKKEEHLWAESYNCGGGDILAFQMDVAEKVAEQITRRLAPSWKPHAPQISPVRIVRDAHLKTNDSLNTFTNDGFWKAREYWQKVVRDDPAYPQAYAALAESYNMLGMTGLLDTTDALDEARGAAKKAVEMDDSLAEAHCALAHTYAVEWNWEAAALEFNQALELDPSLTAGNPCHYAEFLMAVKDPGQAALEIERMRAIQPSSSFLGLILGWAYYGDRDYDRAIREHQALLKNNPKHLVAHLVLALDHSQKKRYGTALRKCHKVLSFGKARLAMNALGYICAAAGDKDGAKEVLNQLKRLLRTSFASPYALAAIYAGLGERDAAFDFLEQACERHDPELIWLRWDPQLANLRSDTRFSMLLNRMGLQPIAAQPRAENHLVSEIDLMSA
jgi:TolB-like protein/tetratricopeptide (TPR) repeat protein